MTEEATTTPAEDDGFYSSIGYALSAVTVVIGLVLIFLLFKPTVSKSKKKDQILFIGPCGSGKTLLTRKLAYSSEPTTVMSSQVSVLTSSDRKFELVDFPGHPKLRSQLTEYLRRARKIVFLFDASNTQSQLRDAAELLYDLFTNPEIDSSSGRMLILCNKSDVKGARPHARVKMALQDELEKIKGTRRSLEDGDDVLAMPLGRANQRFSFDQDAPLEVFFADSSAKTGDLQEIVEFIDS
jgi:signal recognition particle receptor subunit beta